MDIMSNTKQYLMERLVTCRELAAGDDVIHGTRDRKVPLDQVEISKTESAVKPREEQTTESIIITTETVEFSTGVLFSFFFSSSNNGNGDDAITVIK